MLYLFQILEDYVFHNGLIIDKSMYMAVITGQITIYGILLAIYQFIPSVKGKEKGEYRYLGVDIVRYYLMNRMRVVQKFISEKFFLLLFLLEILYKPIITIYGHLLDYTVVCCMNFIWYFFAVTYVVLFVFLLFQYAQRLLTITVCFDENRNYFIYDQINENFLKRTMNRRGSENNIDLLIDALNVLTNCIREDDDQKFRSHYNELFEKILEEYSYKKRKIYSHMTDGHNKWKKCPRNDWKLNARKEVELLYHIIDGRYFKVDEENVYTIYGFCTALFKLNLKYAKEDDYDQLDYDDNMFGFSKNKLKSFHAGNWRKLIIRIYQEALVEQKKKLISSLYNDMEQSPDLYRIFCVDCIKAILKEEINNIYLEKTRKEDFVGIFTQTLKEKKFNDFFADIMREPIRAGDLVDSNELINLLNPQNCMYLFAYTVLYYSIYKFRLKWEYINVGLLQHLWEKHGDVEGDASEVIDKLRNSEFGHRFKDEMYLCLMRYISQPLESGFWNKVYTDNILNVFYIWVIKTCITNVLEYTYITYKETDCHEIIIEIVNELSKHDELLELKNMNRLIQEMRCFVFQKMDSFPYGLNISLKNLLLTDLNVQLCYDYMQRESYADGMGEYLLVKVHELSNDMKQDALIKDKISEAFIASKKSIDEYISVIEKNCQLCSYEIIQKEKMKEYLSKI